MIDQDQQTPPPARSCERCGDTHGRGWTESDCRRSFVRSITLNTRRATDVETDDNRFAFVSRRPHQPGEC